MRKYFGTDGIRGKAGETLTAQLAFRAGLAFATVLGREQERPLVLIGRDTRISGPMLEGALVSGLCSGGADVALLGVIPTPAVALFTAEDVHASGGVMISASHNPYEDNGIKFFGPLGFKLTDAQELELEALMDGPPQRSKTGAQMGAVVPFPENPAHYYAEGIRYGVGPFDDFSLLIDCANGSASTTAWQIFPATGASCTFMADRPDGLNINANCGSTHMEALRAAVRAGDYDLGLAFDGDADRFLAVDERGNDIDGDRILGILAAHMQREGLLHGPLVATMVSNLGLHARMKELGIGMLTTQVGDRYVLEEMRKSGCNLGGEQSGHVILLDWSCTGDGQLTAIMLLSAMKATGRKASELAGDIELYPQTTVNVTVPGEMKHQIAALPEVLAVSADIETAFGGQGRVIIRPSGTEAKVRVMVEGKDAALVDEMVKKAVAVIEAVARA